MLTVAGSAPSDSRLQDLHAACTPRRPTAGAASTGRWLAVVSSSPARAASWPVRARVRRQAPDPPRRRWSVRARDLQHRTAYVIVAVHVPSATVTLHLRGPAVLTAADVRRLQRHLGDALACVLADGGDW